MPKKKKKKISIEEEYMKYKDLPNSKWERVADYINDNKYTIDKLAKLVIKYNNQKKQNKKKGKLNFVIDMVPKCTPRPRLNLFTKSIYVEGSKKNKKFFEKLILTGEIDLGGNIICTPTKMDIKFYLPIPSSLSKDDKILAELGIINEISKPDWDNLGKTTDMFTELVWLDDALVTDVRVRKFYSMKPRVEVKIKYFLEHDSKYNKNKIEKSKTYKRLFNKMEDE